MVSRHKFAAAVLIYSLTLTACGGGGIVSPPPPSGPGSITGVLADTRGGPALSGATLGIEGTTQSATTDANGAFSFAGVTPGTYNLLATRAGYGASRLQGVVAASGAPTDVRMQMRTSFDPAKPVAAPTIAVSGLAPGATVSGTFSFTISVTAANPMRRIDVRFGHRGDDPNNCPPMTALCPAFEDTSSATVTWTTTSNANGANFVNIIAYDNNYNLVEWSIPVTISNAPAGSVPAAPASTFATAVTFGRPVNVFRAQREALARAGLLREDPRRLPLLQGRFLDIQAAPPDSTLFVYILWSPVAGATGYKVYRSFSAGGPFTLLADARAGTGSDCTVLAFGGMTLCHRDSSPDVAVGSSVFYRVTAYTTAGESTVSATAGTTPLAVFNLNLTSPADETTGVPPGGVGTQTFSYAPVAVIGTLRRYQGWVAGINDDPGTWWLFCVDNATTITYSSGTCAGFSPAIPLQRAKRHEWDVFFAFAYTAYGTGDAFSMAGFRQSSIFPPQTWSSGSLNGPFRFTTAP